MTEIFEKQHKITFSICLISSNLTNCARVSFLKATRFIQQYQHCALCLLEPTLSMSKKEMVKCTLMPQKTNPVSKSTIQTYPSLVYTCAIQNWDNSRAQYAEQVLNIQLSLTL